MQAVIHLDKELYKLELFRKLSQNPYELKLCGKKILDFYFEKFSQLNIKKVFLNYFSNVDLELIKEYEKSGFEIESFSYESLEHFYKDSFSQVSSQELLCIENIGFFDFSDELYTENFRYERSSFRIHFIKEHKIDLELNLLTNYKEMDFVLNIDSYKEYFLTAKYILNNSEKFDLKNYSKDTSILIGKDTIIHKNVKLIEPVIIDDEVKISQNSTIGPNVVIHKGVVVQENCEIKNSIIYEETFLTDGLSLDSKLVFKENLFDFPTNILYEIDNKFISKSRFSLFKKLFNFLK